MKSKMFVIYDSKVGAYHRPFFAQTTGEAKRMVMATALKEDSMFFQYPEDYTLFEMGEYDDYEGTMDIYERKDSIGNIISLAFQAKNAKNLAQHLEEEEIEIEEIGKPFSKDLK